MPKPLAKAPNLMPQHLKVAKSKGQKLTANQRVRPVYRESTIEAQYATLRPANGYRSQKRGTVNTSKGLHGTPTARPAKGRNANYAVDLGPASFMETATGARLCLSKPAAGPGLTEPGGAEQTS
jgi:hypothetical protein